MNQPLALRGCTPEPLGNYLKALGVFRLIAEQADPNAMGYWKDGLFWLVTNLSKNNLADFFVKGVGEFKYPFYSPTPIFAPWGGRPGFYDDGNEAAKRRLIRIRDVDDKATRLRAAKNVIITTFSFLKEHGWTGLNKKQREKIKQDIIRVSRSRWPADALPWFDACLAMEEDARFGFLYGMVVTRAVQT